MAATKISRKIDNEKCGWKEIHLKILNSSSISESPLNNGCWLTISANIQPTDHTSTGVE
jgi:hypothetical protein